MRILIFITTLILLTFTGCTSSEAPKSSTNANTTNAGNTSAARSNADNPLATQSKPREETVNRAETVAPAVQAFCDALRRKDEAALRKIYSKASLAALEKDMRADKTNSLVEYLSNEPVGDKCEVRNEKIENDSAIAEVRTETYPNGVQMYFVKENNEWKITNESPELKNVDKNTFSK